MNNIFQYLPSHLIGDFLDQFPPQTFARFICCNKQAYSIGKHMIEKKMTESLKKIVYWTGCCILEQTPDMPPPQEPIKDQEISLKYVYYVLPNGNRHGLQIAYLQNNEIKYSTNFRNEVRHGVHKEYSYPSCSTERFLDTFEVYNEKKGMVFGFKCAKCIKGKEWFMVKSFVVRIGNNMTMFKCVTSYIRSQKKTFVLEVGYLLPKRVDPAYPEMSSAKYCVLHLMRDEVILDRINQTLDLREKKFDVIPSWFNRQLLNTDFEMLRDQDRSNLRCMDEWAVERKHGQEFKLRFLDLVDAKKIDEDWKQNKRLNYVSKRIKWSDFIK